MFRTVAGTKFHVAVVDAIVAFEADGYEPSGRSGWSVVAQGATSVITDPTERARLSTLTINPWTIDGAADRLVRLRAARLTGRRFVR